jgi:Kef-type K+ transport system membrane component KefB
MLLSLTPAPPLGSHPLLILLLQMIVLLVGAVLLGRLAVRLGLPAVVGELMTGVLLGPSLLGATAPELAGWLLPATASQANLLDAVSQLGVLLLVGVTGMQLDLTLLRRRSRAAAPVGLFGIAIPLGLGFAVGYLMPATMLGAHDDRGVFALFLGVAMGVSAIPVIAKTLDDLGLLHRDMGQLTLTAATMDDAFGWLLLSIVSAAAVTGVTLTQISLSVAYTVLLVPVATLAARPAVGWALWRASRSGESGTTGAVAVIVVLLGAAGTHALGLEPVLGAFVAGILAGASGIPNRLLAPLRTVVLGVLAPLFLATVGLRMDLTELARPEVALAAAVVTTLAITGKFAGAYLGARLSRLTHWEGVALGAGLNARGAVEAVVAMVGLRVGVLNAASYTVVIVVAIVTSLMAPPLVRYAMARVPISDSERDRKAAEAVWMAPPPAEDAEVGTGVRSLPLSGRTSPRS